MGLVRQRLVLGPRWRLDRSLRATSQQSGAVPDPDQADLAQLAGLPAPCACPLRPYWPRGPDWPREIGEPGPLACDLRRQLDDPPGTVGGGVPDGEQPDQPLATRVEAGERAARRGAPLPAVDRLVELPAQALQPQCRLGHFPPVQRMPRRGRGRVPGPQLALRLRASSPDSQIERLPRDRIPRHARQRQGPPEHARHQRLTQRPERQRPGWSAAEPVPPGKGVHHLRAAPLPAVRRLHREPVPGRRIGGQGRQLIEPALAAHSPYRGFSPPGPPTAPVVPDLSTPAMTGAIGLAGTTELARMTGEKPAPGGLP